MKYFVQVSVLAAIFTSTQTEAGAKRINWTCQFGVPRVHRDQSWDPYEGRAYHKSEAKIRTLEACRADLEDLVPGFCDDKFINEPAINCAFTPGWEW